MKEQIAILLHNKTFALTVAGMLIVCMLVALNGVGFAQLDQVKEGISATGDSPPNVTVGTVIASAINIISFIIGVIAVIMIIIGGLKYITSTGDAQKVESAKNTIIYAVIGLVIVILAQVIVRYVLTAVESGGSTPTP